MSLGANSSMTRSDVPYDKRGANHAYYVQLVNMFKTTHKISHQQLADKLQISRSTLADRLSGTIIVKSENIYALENLRNELGLGNTWDEIE